MSWRDNNFWVHYRTTEQWNNYYRQNNSRTQRCRPTLPSIRLNISLWERRLSRSVRIWRPKTIWWSIWKGWSRGVCLRWILLQIRPILWGRSVISSRGEGNLFPQKMPGIQKRTATLRSPLKVIITYLRLLMSWETCGWIKAKERYGNRDTKGFWGRRRALVRLSFMRFPFGG